MKSHISCTPAMHAYVCFAVVIFLTIALPCNGTPARTTAIDSVSVEGVWKDTNNNVIVVEETGKVGKLMTKLHTQWLQNVFQAVAVGLKQQL